MFLFRLSWQVPSFSARIVRMMSDHLWVEPNSRASETKRIYSTFNTVDGCIYCMYLHVHSKSFQETIRSPSYCFSSSSSSLFSFHRTYRSTPRITQNRPRPMPSGRPDRTQIGCSSRLQVTSLSLHVSPILRTSHWESKAAGRSGSRFY